MKYADMLGGASFVTRLLGCALNCRTGPPPPRFAWLGFFWDPVMQPAHGGTLVSAVFWDITVCSASLQRRHGLSSLVYWPSLLFERLKGGSWTTKLNRAGRPCTAV